MYTFVLDAHCRHAIHSGPPVLAEIRPRRREMFSQVCDWTGIRNIDRVVEQHGVPRPPEC